MIDPGELAICRRRGHQARVTDQGWSQCGACGMWLREKRTVEEREDEPPEAELDPPEQTKRHIAALERDLKKRIPPENLR